MLAPAAPPCLPDNARYQAWLEADAGIGPQRAYHLACRLAEELRPHGLAAAACADWALAHTLFWRGRFEESRVLLTAIRLADSASRTGGALPPELLVAAQLSWALALLDQRQAALIQAGYAMTLAQSHPETSALAVASGFLGLLHCFLDAPEASLAATRQLRASASDTAQTGLLYSARLLEYWAQSRLGRPTDETAAQTALAGLRRLGTAHEARAFNLYALGQYYQSPKHALTQIDAALDLNARHGLHHWEAHLLHLKSRSLDANGLLHAASRFHDLARQTAQRQNARLFLSAITGIESRTHADPDMDYAA